MDRAQPSKPSRTVEEDDPKLETSKEPSLDSTDWIGNREELRVSSTPLDAVDQPPAKDSESVVSNQNDPTVKTFEDPLDLSLQDSVAGFDSLDWFWNNPSFEELRVENTDELLDLFLKDSLDSIDSLLHVSLAEPSEKASESVVSEPFVSDSPVSCAPVNFNETEVNKRDEQKQKGEKAQKKTNNYEVASISSSRRAEEKKSDDAATMSKVLDKQLQKSMATKRRSEETGTCSTSNKKNKNKVVSPRGSEAEIWLYLPDPCRHYPIRYQILQNSSPTPGITEPLVLFEGQNRLNQPMGGFVRLSEFPQLIQETYSLPNAPSLPNLNLQTHPQPHLGGRV